MMLNTMDAFKSALLAQPELLKPAAELASNPSLVPSKPGIYAYYTDRELPLVPVNECHRNGEYYLLFLDSSPQDEPQGSIIRKGDMRKRILADLRRDARASSFRRSLGCLLSQVLGIELRRVTESTSTFHTGEAVLSQWIADHLFVSWIEHHNPWALRDEIQKTLFLPLNQNISIVHPFHGMLNQLREEAADSAKRKEIVKP